MVVVGLLAVELIPGGDFWPFSALLSLTDESEVVEETELVVGLPPMLYLLVAGSLLLVVNEE